MIWFVVIALEVLLLIATSAGIKFRRTPETLIAEDIEEPLPFPILFSCFVCIGSVLGLGWNIMYLTATIVDGYVSVESIIIIASALSLLSRPAQFQFYVSLGGQNVDLSANTSAIMQTLPLCVCLLARYFALAAFGPLVVVFVLLLVAAAVLLYRAYPSITPSLVLPICLLSGFQLFALAVRFTQDDSQRALIAQQLLPFCSVWLALLCSLHTISATGSWASLLWTSFLVPALCASIGSALAALADPQWYSLFAIYTSFLFNGAAGVVGANFLLYKPVGLLLGIPNAGHSFGDDPYLRFIVVPWNYLSRVVNGIPFIGDFFAGLAEATVD